ncbi:hypothetical protein ACLIYP_00380 [Streptomyces nanhaiensis]|uniref:hypothetical protein n=1 Tax=Streptomyces nanhaiensis TaxID=679319 RepID=UPI00399CAADC
MLRDHGWPEAADHEFHPAPDRSLPTTPALPDTPAHRPDPWRWATAHAISRAACHRSPHLHAVKDAQDAAGPLRYFTPTWLTDHEVETVPWEEAAMHWGPVPDLHPDAADGRFRRRRAATRYDDDLHEAVFPPVQHLVLHDPLRPDLTGITAGRSTGLPERAWWQATGPLHLTVCLSAWWPLEVAARPWHRVQSLTALDVLTWDLERCAPHQMLLLDWTDDPTARLLPHLGPWAEETGGPLARSFCAPRSPTSPTAPGTSPPNSTAPWRPHPDPRGLPPRARHDLTTVRIPAEGVTHHPSGENTTSPQQWGRRTAASQPASQLAGPFRPPVRSDPA